jgi:hypothetical protein
MKGRRFMPADKQKGCMAAAAILFKAQSRRGERVYCSDRMMLEESA